MDGSSPLRPVVPPCDPATDPDCVPPDEQCFEQIEVSSDGEEVLCLYCYSAAGELVVSECYPVGPPPCDPTVDPDCAPPGDCWEEITEDDTGVRTICVVCVTADGMQTSECWTEGTEPQPGGQMTVTIDPVQCGGNLWDGFLSDPTGAPADDFVELVAWLDSLGVVILSVENVVIATDTCEACSCPRGDRYFVTTNADGAAILEGLGFSYP